VKEDLSRKAGNEGGKALEDVSLGGWTGYQGEKKGKLTKCGKKSGGAFLREDEHKKTLGTVFWKKSRFSRIVTGRKRSSLLQSFEGAAKG